MTSLPPLSVVLPIYNGGKYLQEALQSVLHQTLEDFELIAINDGSTDSSLEILQSCNDARLRIFTQQNQGLIATLRRGVELARAPLIARMDQDDVCLPQRFAIQTSFMDKHPEVGVCGGAVILDEFGKQRILRFPTNDLAIRWCLCFTSPIVHPTVVFRKAVVNKVDNYRQSHEAELSEDYDLWTRLARITRFTNLNDPILILRKHGGNMTLRSNTRHLIQSQGVSQRYVQNILEHSITFQEIATIRLENSQPEYALSASVALKQLYEKFMLISTEEVSDRKLIDRDFFSRIFSISSMPLAWGNKVKIYRLALSINPVRAFYYFLLRNVVRMLAAVRKATHEKNLGN